MRRFIVSRPASTMVKCRSRWRTQVRPTAPSWSRRSRPPDQGRFGRSWHSEPGAGLYIPQIRRPKLCPDRLPLVTLALGLAVGRCHHSNRRYRVDLRWPNDVLIGTKKCAGILAQLSEGVLLIGIGINVNHTTFPRTCADRDQPQYRFRQAI